MKAPETSAEKNSVPELNHGSNGGDDDDVKLHKLISGKAPLDIIKDNFEEFVFQKIAYEFNDTPVMTWAVRVYQAGELYTIPYYPFSLKPFIARLPEEYVIIDRRLPELAREFVEKARNNPELNAYHPELLDVFLKQYTEGVPVEQEPEQMSLIPYPSCVFQNGFVHG